jgi:hypothetical protein
MPVLTCPHSFLHDSDHDNCPGTADACPRQTQHQRIELDTFECAIGTVKSRPDELALVQSACCQPDADTVMHQDFDALATLVGKEVGRVGVGAAKDGYTTRANALSIPARMSMGAVASQMASSRIMNVRPAQGSEQVVCCGSWASAQSRQRGHIRCGWWAAAVLDCTALHALVRLVPL